MPLALATDFHSPPTSAEVMIRSLVSLLTLFLYGPLLVLPEFYGNQSEWDQVVELEAVDGGALLLK